MSIRIGVVGVSSILKPEVEARTRATAARLYPDGEAELLFAPFHAPCGHFAGTDAERAADFLRFANDQDLDALWFCRGGYGSGRLIETIVAGLEPQARDKAYLGYSDAGSLMATLYAMEFPKVFHGPMPHDALGYDSDEPTERGLRWLVERDPDTLEPSVDGETPTAAFNTVILANLCGTPWMPNLTGHVVMLEEVAEEMYRIDRCLFQLVSSGALDGAAGLRLGRWKVKPNDPEFGLGAEEVLRYWADRAGVPYLGEADIGHDPANKVVPFG